MAAQLSMEAKLREVVSWIEHALGEKLTETFESLKGPFSGINKEGVEKSLSTMEDLVVKWTQKEGTLFHGKFQIRMLVNFLKQAIEHAKNLLMQENPFIRAEFASVRVVLLRLIEEL